MSALGQKQTFCDAASALPTKADICSVIDHLRFGPEGHISSTWIWKTKVGFAHQGLLDSVVVYFWKEIAPTFGRHVEQPPERVDKIASAMVLLRSGRGKAHL